MPSKKSRPDSRRAAQPRLRVLAGPNGSGKSTIKGELKPEWIGVFVNADEIERSLRESGGMLDLKAMGIAGEQSAVLARMAGHVRSSTFAQALGLHAQLLGHMTINASLQLRMPGPYNSYVASVLADAVRRELLVQLVDRQRMELAAATLPRWFVETELWHSFNG